MKNKIWVRNLFEDGIQIMPYSIVLCAVLVILFFVVNFLFGKAKKLDQLMLCRKVRFIINRVESIPLGTIKMSGSA
ncbi:hypothetical protein [Paenibacillus sp. GCM10028914]|uniref:hypothetical protein n=1 Tax=Paenibacillus sp. GCM10028914 TaxID=3273416 RepID=UPI003623E30E